MRSTNIKDCPGSRQQGFTLVELMIASVVSLLVFAALFSAYLYIARNITRTSYFQQQSVQSARILHLFTNDVSSALSVTVAGNTQLTLQLPSARTVVYTYTYSSAEHGTLQRADTSGATITLTGITPITLNYFTPANPAASNIFNYYNQSGTDLLPTPALDPPDPSSVTNLNDIKQIELSYLSTDGDTSNGNNSNGTKSQHAFVSSRVVLRNKPPFGQ